MKKVLSLSIMALALIAFAATTSSACGTCGCSSKAKETSATKTSEKSSCASKTDAEKAACASKASGDKASCSSKTNATKASASASCSEKDMEACAKKLGVSVDECKKMCSEKGSMTMHTISIEGMTCGSCEASLTKVIEAVPGVKKVVSISHKDKNAVVCVDKKNTCTTTLTKAITDKGYKAQIIPAVATTAVSAPGDKKACAKSCSTAEKAACASKETKKAEDTK